MPAPAAAARQPRADWLPRSIVCGFWAATMMLTCLLCAWMGTLLLSQSFEGAGGMWLHNLAYNSLVTVSHNLPWLALGLHFVVGTLLALLYGYYAEPRMQGSPAYKGVLFALFPWLLSVFIFFPMAGAGALGFQLGAGPFPVVGNLILHVVYGLTLGILYGPTGDRLVEMSMADRESHEREGRLRGGSRGIVAGAVVALVLAAVLHLWIGSEGAMGLPASWFDLSVFMFCCPMGYLIGLVVHE